MRLKISAIPAILACVLLASCSAPRERAVANGTNPVFSPDGSRIAFQRLDGDVFKIGVVNLAGGAVEWVEEGPGNAAYPAWTPDGALAYMWGNDAGTAREAWKKGSQSGYGLRIREPDGTKRDLTRGRCRDYTPCVSPDGRAVWFVTTRGVESESASFSKAAATRIARLNLDWAKASHRGTEARSSGHDGQVLDLNHPEAQSRGEAGSHAATEGAKRDVEIVLDAPNGSNSGYVQPAVSPDGSMLVWGQMDSFFDGWRICGKRMDDMAPKEVAAKPPCPVTPSSLTALSPRWHPNGRMICFTGFHAGDDGWGVWVEDVYTGKVRRLCTGETPCFSPDGGSIAYDRDGMIFVRPFGKGDIPNETLPDAREEDAPERVAWGCEACERQDQPAARDLVANDSRFVFGDDTTVFIRAKVSPGDGARQFLTAAYAEHPRALQLYASGGQMWFVSFDHAGKFFAAKAPVPNGGDVRVLAVRTPTRLLLSLDGGSPAVVHTGGAIPLDTPQRLNVGAGAAAVEIGTGWPRELPKPPTREDLFK
ncbi:MAG: PD40 domain-containing protein [Kiritimatiellae bacterium]|nr:PD40 domain-containing protein [Kiritimatiellia bacterium]